MRMRTAEARSPSYIGRFSLLMTAFRIIPGYSPYLRRIIGQIFIISYKADNKPIDCNNIPKH